MGGGARPEGRLRGGSNAAPQAARRPALQDPGRRPPGPPHASLILPVAPPLWSQDCGAQGGGGRGAGSRGSPLWTRGLGRLPAHLSKSLPAHGSKLGFAFSKQDMVGSLK